MAFDWGYFTQDQWFLLIVFFWSSLLISQIKGQQAICYCLIMAAAYIRVGPDLLFCFYGSVIMAIFTWLGGIVTVGRK